jgi:cytochrome c-type biogenesis protein CcsB
MAQSQVLTVQPATTGGRRLRLLHLLPLPLFLLVALLIRKDLAHLPDGAGDLSLHLYVGVMLVYAAAMVAFCAYFAYRRPGALWVGMALLLPGVALHLVSILARGVAEGHYPLSNMYEYASMFALVAIVTFLVLDRRYHVAPLGAGVVLVAVLMMGAGLMLYVSPEPLIPALQSYWLRIHVTAMMTASGILTSSFVFAVLYLVRARAERVGAPAAGSLAARLPASAVLDNLSYRTVLFGFPIWTFGVMAGAVWGEHAWGRYWAWDPKETMALVTWIIYAMYLHAGTLRRWRGQRTALIAAAGFISLLCTLFVVNLVIVGLHSYAR